MSEKPVRFVRVLLRVWGIVVAVMFLMSVRVIASSREELETARNLRTRGDFDGAIVHFRRSAAFYVPWNPYSTAALSSLVHVARDSERAGHVDVALSAWRSVRAALMQARSFYIPHREHLEAANGNIASLTVRLANTPSSRTNQGVLRVDQVRARLAHDEDPRFLGSVLVLSGFLAWVGGAFFFSTYAIDEEDRFVPGVTRRLSTVVLVGLLLFVLGLLIA